MLMGPGEYGPFDDVEYVRQVEAGRLTANKLGQLRTFSQQVGSGDVILLRQGHEVVDIGVAFEAPYSWEQERFDDVYGWDLHHCRRVRWFGLTNELQLAQRGSTIFGDRKQIPTFTSVSDRKVLDRIEPLLGSVPDRPLRDLPPKSPSPLGLDEVGAGLFRMGLSNESVERVMAAIRRQRRLADWYKQADLTNGRPTEHEVVAHMILPLLLALGWSEQFVAVEWSKIDLAGFIKTPTVAANCILICEAKGLGHGLDGAFEQARRYVQDLGLEACQKIVVTDGLRLYTYQRRIGGGFEEAAGGYINFGMIRTEHVAPRGTDGLATLFGLTPSMAGGHVP